MLAPEIRTVGPGNAVPLLGRRFEPRDRCPRAVIGHLPSDTPAIAVAARVRLRHPAVVGSVGAGRASRAVPRSRASPIGISRTSRRRRVHPAAAGPPGALMGPALLIIIVLIAVLAVGSVAVALFIGW